MTGSFYTFICSSLTFRRFFFYLHLNSSCSLHTDCHRLRASPDSLHKFEKSYNQIYDLHVAYQSWCCSRWMFSWWPKESLENWLWKFEVHVRMGQCTSPSLQQNKDTCCSWKFYKRVNRFLRAAGAWGFFLYLTGCRIFCLPAAKNRSGLQSRAEVLRGWTEATQRTKGVCPKKQTNTQTQFLQKTQVKKQTLTFQSEHTMCNALLCWMFWALLSSRVGSLAFRQTLALFTSEGAAWKTLTHLDLRSMCSWLWETLPVPLASESCYSQQPTCKETPIKHTHMAKR